MSRLRAAVRITLKGLDDNSSEVDDDKSDDELPSSKPGIPPRRRKDDDSDNKRGGGLGAGKASTKDRIAYKAFIAYMQVLGR